MARRGSTKRRSVEQENVIAALYRGKRSKSSGAADTDQGDVRCENLLIECKMRMGSVTNPKKPPAWMKDFEKVAKEAYSEGREPALSFRFYDPTSLLADTHGYIDVTVRRSAEDAMRERNYEA